MTKIPKPTSWSAAFDLKYDAWNRLVEVKDGGTTVQTNQFDSLGRRIVRTCSTTSHYYYNDTWQLVEERATTSGNPWNQFVWHPHYVDALAVCYWDGNTDGDYLDTDEGPHYHTQDANFNVTAVVNSSGTVLERYNDTPYGGPTFLNANFTTKSTQNCRGLSRIRGVFGAN